MHKRIILSTLIVLAFVSASAYAVSAAKTEKAPAIASPTPTPKTVKSEKDTKAEDDKYAAIYTKCIKEAEKNEAKYDLLFNACMDKNGFPQEDYETGGQSMEGTD